MIRLSPLPMAEAIEFWRDKVQMRPKDFRKLSAEAKLKAFSVGGMAKGDELAGIYLALQAALAEGISYGEFKKRIKTTIDKRGWTGPKAWRVDNLFRTNIQTAYSVGRYKQMQTVAETRPYWLYDAVNDSRTRPTHAAMDGKVFPADSPFWEMWYPPNGFRCRCTVVSLSEAQVKRMGLAVSEKDPSGGLIEPVDPVTGVKLPARLLMPDPGWAFHPGKNYWQGLKETLAEKAASWPAPVAEIIARELAEKKPEGDA